MVLPGQGFCNIKASHSPEFLLLFEKEKLMGLHEELSADFIIVVDHNTVHAMPEELLPGCQPGRPGSNDGNRCPEDLYCLRFPDH